MDHRVVSVLGSAARRKPHSRLPEPLELAGNASLCQGLREGGPFGGREF